jgi:hypothetical protein
MCCDVPLCDALWGVGCGCGGSGAGIGLLSVATLIVDFVMSQCAANRAVIERARLEDVRGAHSEDAAAQAEADGAMDPSAVFDTTVSLHSYRAQLLHMNEAEQPQPQSNGNKPQGNAAKV